MTYPTITTPGNDLASLLRTATTLKEAVEQMIGLRGAQHMPSIYVQTTPPSGASEGDFWLCNSTKTTLSIMVNGKWVTTGTLT